MSKTLGNMIRQSILMKDLTQKEAAQLLNISPQTFNNYLHDRRRPTLECFTKMIHVLGLDPIEALHLISQEKELPDYQMYFKILQLTKEQRHLIQLQLDYFQKHNAAKTKSRDF